MVLLDFRVHRAGVDSFLRRVRFFHCRFSVASVVISPDCSPEDTIEVPLAHVDMHEAGPPPRRLGFLRSVYRAESASSKDGNASGRLRPWGHRPHRPPKTGVTSVPFLSPFLG